MSARYELKGKCALVTGGARRLGSAVCRALAREGVALIIHYNSSGREAEELARGLEDGGASARTIRADLSRKDEYETLLERARGEFGRIDILINNASIFPSGRIDRISEDDLFANITVNALAPLVLSREFARQAEEGVIINVLDTRIVEYDRAHAAYHVSKRLLADFTRMTALEFAPRIRVNAVAPGLILPPEGEGARYFIARIKDVPLGRHGEPEDVAEAVIFLLRSPFVTGQIIFVDGGQRLRGDTYGY